EYKQNILNVDPDIKKEFNNVLLVTTGSFESPKKQHTDFTKTFFDDIPVIAALALLSKFQNNVRIIENRTLEFCHNHLASTGHRWNENYVGFATISSSCIRPNEQVEVTAG